MSPSSPKKPCNYPNCSELVTHGYCEKHQPIIDERKNTKKKQWADPHRDPERQRLYDRTWQARRRAYMAQHPWCEDCAEWGLFEPAQEVHHVIPHKGNREIFVSSPLRALCKICHSRRTRQEITGKEDNYFPKITHPIHIPVYLVCGPPASGKTTFVREHCGIDDIVIDLDEIISETTGHALYQPEERKTIDEAIRLRNVRLQSLQTLDPHSQSAWLIVSAPTARERTIWKNILKPQKTYLLLCSEAVCCQRIEADERRMMTSKRLLAAVHGWWEKYQSLNDEELIKTEDP
jgi:hypothetical protein